jgi:hypothetical protein
MLLVTRGQQEEQREHWPRESWQLFQLIARPVVLPAVRHALEEMQ